MAVVFAASIIAQVYRKALTITNAVKQSSSVGEIVNVRVDLHQEQYIFLKIHGSDDVLVQPGYQTGLGTMIQLFAVMQNAPNCDFIPHFSTHPTAEQHE